MQPITRLWLKIAVATLEIHLLLIAALAIGQEIPNWAGAIALTTLFAERIFYITGGIGGYVSYRQRIKEARRGESHHHRP